MISPVWEEFHSTSMINENTMFCLRIPKKEDQINVKAEMLSLKPELLLFLRKLHTIHVIVDERKEGALYDFSLRREDNTDNVQHGYTTTQLSRYDTSPAAAASSETLVVFRHTTQSMPEETKRPGIKQTEVVLAFPTVFDNISRMTFNFLPIRDFGFPFLLQADFMTNNNREDINHHNKWNHALLTVAANLLVQCIRVFNKAETPQMRTFKYAWPQFIRPIHTASDTIMVPFFPGLRKQLNDEPVLESRSGHLAAPTSLAVLSERWFDRRAPPQPLFNERHHLELYISENYNQSALSALGLKQQNASYYAALLKKLPPEQLQQKSPEWHSSMAEALLKHPPISSSSLRGIKMIPLREGGWVSMARDEQAPIYFPDRISQVHVPDGVELQIVDPSAVEYIHRRLLFKKMNIQDLDPFQVSELIVK